MTRTLLDLGASNCILSGCLYDQYDFGPLQAATTTVVLADETLKLPRGILTDVIVKVEDFYFLVDFFILDFVSGERTKQSMVILGRPFLATANANIKCRSDTVDMAFESALLEVLMENKEAIGWTIANFKGISSSIVMHKILTDPEVKPTYDA
ncbi:uncharacterized protein LOC143604282 [Bidens hawaiensis]|uniref:uncharacterized protein LOC143604282 n=1 Tax=Bidens hawaiensis TaxID=980011 RepID=UPI004049006A